jgi:hypothetical protein
MEVGCVRTRRWCVHAARPHFGASKASLPVVDGLGPSAELVADKVSGLTVERLLHVAMSTCGLCLQTTQFSISLTSG